MKHIRILIATPVLACGVVLAGASQASAMVEPEPGASGDFAQVVYERGATVAVDDNVAEALQAGASALGGAGIALAALWAYRRRHPVGVQ